MVLALADGRPAHLSRVHAALVGLGEADQVRLGVLAPWKTGTHRLTYRQVEYTFGRVVACLAKEDPDGTPTEALSEVIDDLVEASIGPAYKTASASLAVDWTDLESWATRPHTGQIGTDPEASWGHRRSNVMGLADEIFYGYHLSGAVMVPDEAGPPVPELIRRINLSTCSVDPVPALVPTLSRLVGSGVSLGDVLADSGYSHRVAANWAAPVRGLGGSLVVDLHPHDRGTQGTWGGAIAANGNLYCPAIPKALLDLAPLVRGADRVATAAHDATTAEAGAYKLGPISAPDADGYRRVACPAVSGKVRCPRRPTSMALGYDRPTVLSPPEGDPVCCVQKSLTVPSSVNAKTAQRHDYPGPAWRKAYARRSGAERAFSTLKDPASNDINRGWCRIAGLAGISLFLAAVTVARNLRVTDAFEARVADDARRAEQGRPARTRRRRRKALSALSDPTA
ncbi:MAG: hypothetical protein ACYC0H_13380 [Solirubrobacteraceae bacterium]